MNHIDSESDYDQWVEEIARNNLKYDKSDPRFVADQCIVDVVHTTREGYQLVLAGEPYCEERATPLEVFRHSGEMPTRRERLAYRAMAVDILADDIERAMDQLYSHDSSIVREEEGRDGASDPDDGDGEGERGE